MTKSKAQKARRAAKRAAQAQTQVKTRVARIPRDMSSQIGAVVRTRFPKLGFSDVLNHRVGWILGYTFVGNGTNGAANNVFFQDASSTFLFGGLTGTAGTSGVQGGVPIIGGDNKLGATYISDIEKHYARKRINRMHVTVVSLQPSTSNNMMAVVAPARGAGVAMSGIPLVTATATAVQQNFTNVMSMDDAITVDSFETKTLDITKYIAGGSGAKQNEFDLQANINSSAGTVLTQSATPAIDLDGLVPASLVVSGNSTTSGLQNTKVHAIVITQFIDLLDFIGGDVNVAPVGMATPAGVPSTKEIAEAREILQRVAALSL